MERYHEDPNCRFHPRHPVWLAGVGPAGQRRSAMDDARMKALQECGAMEKKYTQETWGVQQLDSYRACMAQRGQQE